MGDRSNMQVVPRSVYFGAAASFTVTFVADVAGSLNSKWFSFWNGLGTAYYFWLNINAAGTDPAPSGKTGVTAAGATGATATTLAAAAAVAINAADIGIVATSSGAVLTLTMTDMGASTIPANGTASPAFTYAAVAVGSQIDLGFIEGDLEVAFGPEEAVDVKSHQTGANIVERFTTGRVIEAIKLMLQETSKAQLDALMAISNDTMTPAGGVAVSAVGLSKDFVSQSSRSKMLLLHPANVARTVRTGDILFWKAFPQVEKRMFSGEDIEKAEVTFNILPDFTKNSKVQYCVVGEHDQDFLA